MSEDNSNVVLETSRAGLSNLALLETQFLQLQKFNTETAYLILLAKIKALETPPAVEVKDIDITLAGYDRIQEEGVNLTRQQTLNFIGSGVTAADDSGNGRTNVTISAGAGYNQVQDEGSNLTQRTTLNFIGDVVTALDDSANTRTNVRINALDPVAHLKGCMIGTLYAQGSAGNFSPFHGLTSPGNTGLTAVAPVEGYIRTISIRTSASQGAGATSIIRAYVDETASLVATLIRPGEAAGVFQEAGRSVRVREGEPWGFRAKTVGTGQGRMDMITAEFVPTNDTAIIGHDGRSNTIGASTNMHIALGTGGKHTDASGTAPADMEMYLPFACTLQKAYVLTKTAQPATGSLTYTFRKNETDTSLVVTVPASMAAGIARDITNTVSYAIGDTAGLVIANNATSTSAQWGHVAVNLVPTTGVRQLLTCWTYINIDDTAIRRYAFFSSDTIPDETAEQKEMVVTRAGTFQNFYIRGGVDMTGNPARSVTWRLMKNGVSAISLVVQNGSIIWRAVPGTVSVVAGDKVYIETEGSGLTATRNGFIRQMVIEFEPS